MGKTSGTSYVNGKVSYGRLNGKYLSSYDPKNKPTQRRKPRRRK